MFGLGPGDRVRARRDVRGGLGFSPSIRKGRQGIIRSAEGGFFSNRFTVEFEDSWGTVLARGVPGAALSRSLGVGGEERWERRQDYRQGARIGMFLVFGLPALVALARYFLAGGTLAELIPAVLLEFPVLAIQLLLGPFGLLFLIFAIYIYLTRRRR